MNKINEIIYLTLIYYIILFQMENEEDNPVIKEELFNIELKNLPKRRPSGAIKKRFRNEY